MISEDELAELRQELVFSRNEALKAEHNLEVAEGFIRELKASLTEVREERDGAEKQVNELDRSRSLALTACSGFEDELVEARRERDVALRELGRKVRKLTSKLAEKVERIEDLEAAVRDAARLLEMVT